MMNNTSPGFTDHGINPGPYQEQLDKITSRKLTPRNLNVYAENALNDLIALIESALEKNSAYNDSNTTTREREDAALSYVGLDRNTVEQTLDHIASVTDSIRRLDGLIARKTIRTDHVIVPTNGRLDEPISPGDGSFELPKKRIPKLKTLLLLLETGLDVHIESEDVAITIGDVPPNMMRRSSYTSVEIRSLNRLVMVCDEVGNTTYIFDVDVCKEYGIDVDYLSRLTKVEIDELIKDDDRIGRRIDYSSKYVDNLTQYLTGEMSQDQDGTLQSVDILKPKAPPAPEGYLSLNGIWHEYGITQKTTQKAVDELGSELGEVTQYRFGSKTTAGYSPEQVAKILTHLDIAPPAPEGYLSLNGIWREYGITPYTTQKAIDELGPVLGEVKQYRFGTKTTVGYSPEQVAKILKCIDEQRRARCLGGVATS
jgi:hypothetical protein